MSARKLLAVGLLVVSSSLFAPLHAAAALPSPPQPHPAAEVSKLLPPMAGPDGQIPEVHFRAKRGVSPMTADACSLGVCMQVYGELGFVGTWDTQGYTNQAVCTQAAFYVNGATIARSPVKCAGAGAGVYYSELQVNRTYANLTTLSNTWTVIPGRPFIFIYT